MIKSKMNSEIPGVVFFDIETYEDDRGLLIELFRNDCLEKNNYPKMAYISETKPGVVRGPHEHINQADYFCFMGPGTFELILWENREDYVYEERHIVGAENPVAVIVPPGIIHAYKNISENIGLVFNAPNQLYAGPNKLYEVDEIRHELNKDTIYIVDEDKIHSGVHLVDRDYKEASDVESDVQSDVQSDEKKSDEKLEKKQESDKKDSKKESKDK